MKPEEFTFTELTSHFQIIPCLLFKRRRFQDFCSNGLGDKGQTESLRDRVEGVEEGAEEGI